MYVSYLELNFESFQKTKETWDTNVCFIKIRSKLSSVYYKFLWNRRYMHNTQNIAFKSMAHCKTCLCLKVELTNVHSTISLCISDYNTRKGNLVATRVADYEFISSQFLMAIAFSPHALLPRHSNYCTLKLLLLVLEF